MKLSDRVLSSAVLLALLLAVLLAAPTVRAADNANDAAASSTEAPPEPSEAPATSNAEGKAKKSGVKVLDFDADVIEGERKAPSLFVQLETESPDLDTLVYRRNNFNDFHERERLRRPVYRKPSP